MNEITVEVSWTIIDGWYNEFVEYCLAEVRVGNSEPELILFDSVEGD